MSDDCIYVTGIKSVCTSAWINCTFGTGVKRIISETHVINHILCDGVYIKLVKCSYIFCTKMHAFACVLDVYDKYIMAIL